MNNLENEIDRHKKEIHSDAYPMSIGEAVSLYQNGELEIHPEFQRVFRWNDNQKTKFIESILLGIPLPSFFVSQREDGVWDLVDGLQRFSTILSFMGELKDENGNKREPFEMCEGEYLKSLKGIMWSDEAKFTKAMKLAFRREKIDFKIIKKESTPDTKYELFRRINTGGSALTDQEVRNCLLLMANRNFYKELEKMSANEDFLNCIFLSEDKILRQYHSELIVRFIVFYKYNWKVESSSIPDLTSFLDDHIIDIARNGESFEDVVSVFCRTFKLLNMLMGENSFRKYFVEQKKYKGAFSIALFEAISVGIARNIDKSERDRRLKNKINNFSLEQVFIDYSGAGIRASSRIVKTIPHAIEYFS